MAEKGYSLLRKIFLRLNLFEGIRLINLRQNFGNDTFIGKEIYVSEFHLYTLKNIYILILYLNIMYEIHYY